MSLMIVMGQKGVFLCFCHDFPLMGACGCVSEGHGHQSCKEGCHHSGQKKITHEDTCQHVWVDGYVYISPGGVIDENESQVSSFDYFVSMDVVEGIIPNPLHFYSELSVRPPPDEVGVGEIYLGYFRPLLA